MKKNIAPCFHYTNIDKRPGSTTLSYRLLLPFFSVVSSLQSLHHIPPSNAFQIPIIANLNASYKTEVWG